MALPPVTSPLVYDPIKKVGSTIWEEVGLFWGVKNDLKKLQNLLQTIRAVLDDAEGRMIHDKALHKSLRDLKDTAIDADDVVDNFQNEALR